MMQIFLDTNIILDYIDSKRRALFPDSVRLFSLIENEKYTMCASALTFSNIAYILRKLDYAELMRIFTDLRTLIKVLPANQQVLDAAINSSFTDFEDAIQYYTAYQGGADVVITRNVDDFADNSIPVMDPSSFLKRLQGV